MAAKRRRQHGLLDSCAVRCVLVPLVLALALLSLFLAPRSSELHTAQKHAHLAVDAGTAALAAGVAASSERGLSAVIMIPGGRLAPKACGPDGVYLKRSVAAIVEATGEVLAEVIVVDDGTEPPVRKPQLAGLDWEHLDSPRRAARRPRLRWLRNDRPTSATAARGRGGDAAAGEAIAFFDCYVKPTKGWAEPVLRLLRDRPRAVALPALHDIDKEAWELIGPRGGTKTHFDNVITWEAESIQLYFPPKDVNWSFPVDQGNVPVFSSSWWKESGGYDRLQVGSSTLFTENIEMSLRVLLCGGEFVPVYDSVVGFCHSQHGTLHHERPDMTLNQARIMTAWFGSWKSKGLSRPKFVEFLTGQRQVGDLSGIKEVQRRLGCADFGVFLQRMRVPLEIMGLLPREVFSFHEKSTGLCLQEWDVNTWGMAPCTGSDSSGQLFVPKNAALDGAGKLTCCTSYGPWNFVAGSASYCLDSRNGDPGPWMCSFWAPSPESQHWVLTNDGQLQNGGVCLAPEPVSLGRPAEEASLVQWGSCQSDSEGLAVPAQRFELRHVEGSPAELSLSLEGGRCLSSSLPGSSEPAVTPAMLACSAGDRAQRWRWLKPSEQIGFASVAHAGQCLDINGGRGPVLYHCYTVEDSTAFHGIQSTNQALWLSKAGHISQWGVVDTTFTNVCLDGSSRPTHAGSLKALPCEETRRRGISWAKRGLRIPEETRLLQSP